MALSITSQPAASALISAYRQVRFVVNSTTANRVNILADIYFDGFYSRTIAVALDGSGNATFDFQNEVQAYIAGKAKPVMYDLPALGTHLDTITQCTHLSCSLYVRFFDEVSDGTGLLTTTWAAGGAGTGYVQSNTAYAFNIPLQQLDTQNFAAFTAGSSTSRFLTNMPDSTGMSLTSSAYLGILYSATGAAFKVVVKTYDSSGTLQNTYSVNNAWAGPDILLFACGPANINNYSAGAITSSIAYYTIQLQAQSDSSEMSEIFTFGIDTKCYEKEREFYFYNILSGWDYFRLLGGEQQSFKPAKTGYQKALAYNFSASDAELLTLNVDSALTIKGAAYLNDSNTMAWITELTDSPVVYTVENNEYVGVIVDDTAINIYNSEAPLIDVQIGWRYAYNRIRQRQ